MNQLINVKIDENQEPVMSARELHDVLNEIESFTDFFIKVSEYKVSLGKTDLKILRTVLKSFTLKFDSAAITYLVDTVSAEMTLPCKQEMPREFREKILQNNLLDNFSYAFPEYKLIGAEIPVNGIGRIDILASNTLDERPVIIELKINNSNPNKQLLAYATKYKNPIMIGITEIELSSELKSKDILYYTFSELRKRAAQWVI